MAISPSHQFGQIIGEVLEAAITSLLEQFAKQHALYLDKKGPRACRRGLKCSWLDLNKNLHDLDFVLERGGTSDKCGSPVAFIETAWRRYTKHSRNKAQEIQGAILPLAETYRHTGPFLGAILAGVFTEGALNQLRSIGFSVLFLPYPIVVGVFREHGIDAAFDESTPDRAFSQKVRAFRKLSAGQRIRLSRDLLDANEPEVDRFIAALTRAISRQIESIIVLPLHGMSAEVAAVCDAIQFIESYDDKAAGTTFRRYEIQIRYSNRDAIEARFTDKQTAIAFLNGFTA